MRISGLGRRGEPDVSNSSIRKGFHLAHQWVVKPFSLVAWVPIEPLHVHPCTPCISILLARMYIYIYICIIIFANVFNLYLKQNGGGGDIDEQETEGEAGGEEEKRSKALHLRMRIWRMCLWMMSNRMGCCLSEIGMRWIKFGIWMMIKVGGESGYL